MHQVTGGIFLNKKMKSALGWVTWIIGVVVVSLLLNMFVFSVADVHQISMEPTLVENDRVIVDKISARLFGPERFDVVVVQFPNTEANKPFIKRVIGMPGDTVKIVDDVLYINDEVVDQPFIVDTATQHTEDYTYPGVIPEGQYLVMGDNRDSSLDGRKLGLLTQDEIIGIGRCVIWPLDDIQWL